MSRTRSSLINTGVSIGGQIIVMFCSFIARAVFVNTLSAEYLGINGLFSNILNMLSLMELGIGVAINYSLYKPIAEKNISKIQSLMSFYRKTYLIIGILVLIFGLGISPMLKYLINDMPDIPNLILYYVLYVLNTAISYFFSYKRSLIIANQQRYIASLYNALARVLCNVSQIIILLVTHSFLLFLVIQIVFTAIENITISLRADKLYPYLKHKTVQKLDKKTFNEIQKNTLAMVFHKIGSVLVMGTDNLLISKFVGVIAIGLYSNYLLITTSLNTFFGLIFQSVTASIGNLGVTESEEKTHFIFKCLNLIGFWLYGFSAICLMNLFNPFIQLWVGEEYLFSMPIVLVIVINFYLTGMRRSVTTYKDALGLYWQDRFKPIFESVINLTISIILVQKLGTIGVFIGTVISTLTTCFWIEPFVLFKYGFKKSSKTYFVRYLLYTLVMLIAGGITWYISSYVNSTSAVYFVIRVIICIFVPNFVFLICFYKLPEFKYLFQLLYTMITRRGRKTS